MHDAVSRSCPLRKACRAPRKTGKAQTGFKRCGPLGGPGWLSSPAALSGGPLNNKDKSTMIDEIPSVCIRKDGSSPVQGQDIKVKVPNA